MIEPIKIQEDIKELTTELSKVATDYRKARVKYSQNIYEMKRMLAERLIIYRKQKKGLGVDMAILMAMGDTEYQDKEKFTEHYKGVSYWEALYKGLSKQFEAIQSQIMALQSLMRFYRDNDSSY